ncbi:MAG: hypothetical protein IPL50_05090 [Chitinophagaceae bacterium]|nr:hypothetical protein [Chitinophagaceae bacterium]
MVIIWIGGMDGTVYQFDPLKNNFIRMNNGILLNDGYLNPDGSKLINGNLFLSDGKSYALYSTAVKHLQAILFSTPGKNCGRTITGRSIFMMYISMNRANP